MSKFVGRRLEYERLSSLLRKKSASLVVVKGRRRIGKSRLLAEFGHKLKTHTFTGLPPSKDTTAQLQREEFRNQLEQTLGLHGLSADDWSGLFWNLARQNQAES